MTINVQAVGRANIAMIWREVEPLIQRVIDTAYKGEISSALEVLAMFMRGEAIGLVGFRDGGEIAGFIALVKTYYQDKFALNCFLFAGAYPGFVRDLGPEGMARFKLWAKSTGAISIECYCSPSMTRLLNRHGFNKTYDFCRLSLED